jgi:uncharacterized protein YndB with AHSA1/START domain
VPAPFRFDRRWTFSVEPARLWEVLQRTEQYPQWWSWLRGFDAVELVPGTSARCVVQAPLPYALHFTVTVHDVVPERIVRTTVSGDLHGPASLEVAPHRAGSEARLHWELELHDPLLRNVARVARPAMVWAHDRVVEIGARQFRDALTQDLATG